MVNIRIHEGSVRDAATVLESVSEFKGQFPCITIERLLAGKQSITVVAYDGSEPVGCVVGFDRDHNGSFYCALVGVIPKFRGRGIMAHLMTYQNEWAKSHGFGRIRIKTQNNRREMLTYLVKNGYHITHVAQPTIEPSNRFRRATNKVIRRIITLLSRMLSVTYAPTVDYRIWLEKLLP